MNRTYASTSYATKALELVESLQQHFVGGLEAWCGASFAAVEWFRDEGRYGGGKRLELTDHAQIGRASVNVSQVNYEEDPQRALASATALSTIIHPVHPLNPSIHIHISWTELKEGSGYWRIMADLNPSIVNPVHTAKFNAQLQRAAADLFDAAMLQGERYFYIPALKRHRGVSHFYLEHYHTGSYEADYQLAERVGRMITTYYVELLQKNLPEATMEQKRAQLDYHTLYLFQVLTLDRGTTAGLLVHNQNDMGILGSLPRCIDLDLLAAWRSRLPEPQEQLLDRIVDAFPVKQGICEVDGSVKLELAEAIRVHYQHYPEALNLQASGNTTPPTIEQHKPNISD